MKNELTDEQIDIVLDANSLTLIVESGTHCSWAAEFARAAIAAALQTKASRSGA